MICTAFSSTHISTPHFPPTVLEPSPLEKATSAQQVPTPIGYSVWSLTLVVWLSCCQGHFPCILFKYIFLPSSLFLRLPSIFPYPSVPHGFFQITSPGPFPSHKILAPLGDPMKWFDTCASVLLTLFDLSATLLKIPLHLHSPSAQTTLKLHHFNMCVTDPILTLQFFHFLLNGESMLHSGSFPISSSRLTSHHQNLTTSLILMSDFD